MDNFEGLTIFESQKERRDRPVPYIVDFSQTGVMTIGWDRQMKPYKTPKEIPPKQVAVKPDVLEKATLSDSGLRRRLNEDSVAADTDEIWIKEKEEDEAY